MSTIDEFFEAEKKRGKHYNSLDEKYIRLYYRDVFRSYIRMKRRIPNMTFYRIIHANQIKDAQYIGQFKPDEINTEVRERHLIRILVYKQLLRKKHNS